MSAGVGVPSSLWLREVRVADGWPESVAPDLRALAERVLTPAQLEAYKLVARGYGRRRISVILGISTSAVRDRVNAAERKLVRAWADGLAG